MSKRDERLLLEDIIESAKRILDYTKGLSFDDFIQDIKTFDAVIRNFEIIGEAANRISPELRESYKNVDWTRIRGFRNRIVHDYFGIDYEIVWNIVEKNIHPLIKDIQGILEDLQ